MLFSGIFARARSPPCQDVAFYDFERLLLFNGKFCLEFRLNPILNDVSYSEVFYNLLR